MSSRHATPPSVARWPFILGDVLLLATAAIALIAGETPPGTGQIILATACIAVGIGLLLAPYLMEFEARTRVAEASVRESMDAQARRLVQTAEQLGNAVSRSQSTEEQAGQALGTLEELAERLASQSDDIAQALVRNDEAGKAAMKEEIERLVGERDQQLAALTAALDQLATTVRRIESAENEGFASQNQTLESIQSRLEALEEGRARSVSPSAPPPASTAAHATDATPDEPVHAPASTEDAGAPEPEEVSPEIVESQTSSESPETSDADGGDEADDSDTAKPKAHSTTSDKAPKPKATRQPTRRSTNTGSRRGRSAHDGPELALEDPASPPAAPAKPPFGNAGATSIVATAYIGIGNKLYLRGDGPGLSWDQGVPMQFLAIGKWGWTTTEAGIPITCRIFRNDETPMQDEDVVVAPGEKAEVTPRF